MPTLRFSRSFRRPLCRWNRKRDVGSNDEKKGAPFHNPFLGLSALKETLPEGKTKQQLDKEKPPLKAVIRLERSGRSGKEVTVVEQLNLSVDMRETWLSSLKAKLGCGGQIEGTALVFQGDHRERLPRLLHKQGVKNVVVGN
jgi:translation initiation factor 1